MFTRFAGKTKLVHMPVTVSTAMSTGSAVSMAANTLTLATSATTTGALFGVLRQHIQSSDSDYASARLVPVEVPVEKFVEWEVDSTGTTYAVGEEIDLSTSKVIDRATSSNKVFLIRKVPSSTKVVGCLKVNGSY